MLTITINKKYADLLPKIKLHLSVIGKRAVNVQGESFFVDLTTSAREDKIFHDLIDAAAETIVAEIPDVCSTYSDDDGIRFIVRNDRWEKGDEEFTGKLQTALASAIERYFVNFSIAQFLSSIFPALKGNQLPMYGGPYIEHAAVILKNIKSLAYLKRPTESAGVTYGEMLNADSDYWEDGKIISLLTIKRNGDIIGAYNGTADKVVDIKVPVKLSELENDRKFISGITQDMVLEAIGYTPYNAALLTKQNIMSMLGISGWALAGSKPSYSISEIGGLSDALNLKFNKADFGSSFATEIKKYNLGHQFAYSGEGNAIVGFFLSTDGKTVYFQRGQITGGDSGGGSESGGGGGITSESDPIWTTWINGSVGQKMLSLLGHFSIVDGNIKVDTNFYSEKGISAYGFGQGGSPSTGGWTWDTPSGEGNVVTKVEYLNGHLKVTYGKIEGGSSGASSWDELYPKPTAVQLADILGDTYLKAESDPVFTAHPAHDITSGMIDVLRKLSLVDGNVKVDANLYSTGGVSAYGYGKDDSSGGWTWDEPSGSGNVVTKVEYDNGHLKVTYGTIEASSGGGGGSSITLPIAISNVSGLQDALDKKWEYNADTIKAVKVNNAVAADKLATSRTLWGQSFDGSGNVSGDISNVGDISFSKERNSFKTAIHNDINALWIGMSKDSETHQPLIIWDNSENQADSVQLYQLYSMRDGNVGIGTGSPQSKLHVNGSVRIGNAILTYNADNHSLALQDSDGNPLNLYTTGGISAYGVASGGYESIENLIIDKSLQIGDNCYVTRWINKGYEHLYIYSDNYVYMGNQSTYFDSDGWLYMADSMLVMDEGGGFYKRRMLDGTKATTVSLNDDSLILQNGHSLKIGNTASDHNITDVYADGSYVYMTINGKKYKLQNA